jgi:hypothetical protein
MTYQVKGPVNVAPGVVLRRVAALALLAASGGVLVSACADNESSLFIRGRKPPDASCVVECSPDGVFDPEGEVDAAFDTSFTVTLVVGNQIVTRGDSDVLRTETSRVQLYEAEVRVVDLAGNPLTYSDGTTAQYAIPLSGTVDPGTSNDAGYGCASVPLLDGGTMEALRASAVAQGGTVDVVSNVIIRGRTLGGQEVESGEWAYPISICVGCTCVDTAPATCCTNAGGAACADLEDIKLSCPGTLSAHDCRMVQQTCGDYLNGFGL